MVLPCPGSLCTVTVLYNQTSMELVWDTVEVFGYVGWILTYAFPLFVIAFIVLRRRYQKKLPSHRTMIVYVLVAVSAGSQIFYSTLVFATFFYWPIKQDPAEFMDEPMMLATVFQLQQAYFAEYNTYAGRTGSGGDGAFADMGWYFGNVLSAYSFYCGGDVIPASVPFKTKMVINNPEADWPDNVPKPNVSQMAFTCVAIGDIDADDSFDVWTVNDGTTTELFGYIRAKHLIDDSGDDGTRMRGDITFKGELFHRGIGGGLGIKFYFMGMLTPLLLLSIVFDIARAVRLRREVGGGD